MSIKISYSYDYQEMIARSNDYRRRVVRKEALRLSVLSYSSSPTVRLEELE